jgi:hypothetical protein
MTTPTTIRETALSLTLLILYALALVLSLPYVLYILWSDRRHPRP